MNPENAYPERQSLGQDDPSPLVAETLAASVVTDRDRVVEQIAKWSSRLIVPVLASDEVRDLLVNSCEAAMRRLDYQEKKRGQQDIINAHQEYLDAGREDYKTLDPSSPEAQSLQEELAQIEVEIGQLRNQALDQEPAEISDGSCSKEQLENSIVQFQSDPKALNHWADEYAKVEFSERSKSIDQLSVALSKLTENGVLPNEVADKLISALREIPAPQPNPDGLLKILLSNHSDSANPISVSEIQAAYRSKFPNREQFVQDKMESFSAEFEYWKNVFRIFSDCFQDSEMAPILTWISELITGPEAESCLKAISQRCTDAIADDIYVA